MSRCEIEEMMVVMLVVRMVVVMVVVAGVDIE